MKGPISAQFKPRHRDDTPAEVEPHLNVAPGQSGQWDRLFGWGFLSISYLNIDLFIKVNLVHLAYS